MRDRPGDGLLDPVAVLALAVLIINDHTLKALAHGTPWTVLTGKLSDIAGVLFLPVLIIGVVELIARQTIGPRGATIVAVAVAVMFTLMKTVDAVGAAYAHTLGALQWPVRAAFAALQGQPTPALVPVVHVVDPTDVVAVLAAPYVVYRAKRRALRNERGPAAEP